jgi:hypothetical protein
VINVANFEAKGEELYVDGKKVLRAWESFTGWYWFATEEAYKQDSVIDGRVHKNDIIWFGLVQGFEEEWGYFSLAEIESLRPKTWEINKWDLPYAGRRH